MVPVGDANVRFGFSDFTLITGLNPEIENDYVKDIPSDRRTERIEQRLPRMCGWRSAATFGFEEIIAVLDEPMDEVLFPLTPTQEEMEKEYVVMFSDVFPEDLRDVHEMEHGGSSRVPPPSTGPSIGMRQVLDVVAMLTKRQDDAFCLLKKVEDVVSIMSGKIEELDRKIYALDQKLEARSQSYMWFTPERQRMETGMSPDYGTVVEIEKNKKSVEEEEQDQVVGDQAEDQSVKEEEEDQTEKNKSVVVEKNKAAEVVDTEMQQHSDVEVVEVEQADTGGDRVMVKYIRKKRSSKHVEKENVLQTGVKRARVPSIHTRTPFTTKSRPQTTTSRTFLDKMQIDFFLPVDPLKAKKFKEWYTKAADR
ncbi:hypothetical protein DH2020_027393 [Rehmannia glutinosa]|uniref:Uncharacterized protein n=1 Tax=Rehmannia glutinosa TaxID=99300 RepID=A0ABR0VYE5_REHGL